MHCPILIKNVLIPFMSWAGGLHARFHGSFVPDVLSFSSSPRFSSFYPFFSQRVFERTLIIASRTLRASTRRRTRPPPKEF